MIPTSKQDEDFPWWLLVAAGLGGLFFYRIIVDDIYLQVLRTLGKGIAITIFVTLVGFISASVIGLGLAVASLSRFRVLRQGARFYIEIIRGVPIIVLLLYVAFVFAPGFRRSIWVRSRRPRRLA